MIRKDCVYVLIILLVAAGLVACGQEPAAEKAAAPTEPAPSAVAQAPAGMPPSMPPAGMPPAGMPPTGMPPSQSSGGSASAGAPFADIQVAKATAANAYTVNELFARAAELDTRRVTVRGQVVKVSLNIMNRNWVHLQDGTGDPAAKTHDLVLTTAGLVETGSVVTMEGVLAHNKDFGFGYRYDVIVEEAAVVE